MENRTDNQVYEILDFIKYKWQLSIEEDDVLESILYLFSARKNNEIKQIEYLINDETEELFKTLNDREVIDYVTENWKFVASDDESGLEDALKDLNYDFSEQIDLDKHIEIVEDHGYVVTELRVKHQADIVTQSQLEEMTEKFLNLSTQERDNLIKNM
jgi:glutamyl-tRNA reductase